MFWQRPTFPFTFLLEENAAVIRREAEALELEAWDDWPDRPSYSHGWKVFGLLSRDHQAPLAETCAGNARRCPRTAALLARVPGLLRGGFSMLMPGAHVYPHADSFEDRVRCHLALWTNPGAGLRMGDDRLSWVEGRCLVFDGHETHEAANLGPVPRVVLLLDVLRARAGDPVAAEEPGLD